MCNRCPDIFEDYGDGRMAEMVRRQVHADTARTESAAFYGRPCREHRSRDDRPRHTDLSEFMRPGSDHRRRPAIG